MVLAKRNERANVFRHSGRDLINSRIVEVWSIAIRRTVVPVRVVAVVARVEGSTGTDVEIVSATGRIRSICARRHGRTIVIEPGGIYVVGNRLGPASRTTATDPGIHL